jgi:hypothetical protein
MNRTRQVLIKFSINVDKEKSRTTRRNKKRIYLSNPKDCKGRKVATFKSKGGLMIRPKPRLRSMTTRRDLSVKQNDAITLFSSEYQRLPLIFIFFHLFFFPI